MAHKQTAQKSTTQKSTAQKLSVQKSTTQKQRRKQAKLRKKQRRLRIIKLIGNAILGGVTLGLAASMVFILAPKILPYIKAKAADKKIVAVYDYTTESRDSASFLSQKPTGTLPTPDNLKILEDSEVEGKLAELARKDKDIADIYAQREKYPEELLAALAANQEMTEFVKGYLTSDGTVTGGINAEEAKQAFPLFLQWDKRWGYSPYGKSSISISGCGPTCLSMVIFSLTRNEKATPDALARLSMDNGYYMEGEGTLWSFMTDGAAEYGINARELGLDEAAMKQSLDMGRPIICAMRPGDFTTTGHFIVIYDYDENGFMINDPNSRQRSNRQWDFDSLFYQIKNLWAYSK
ncbi:MAG: C39 family peptidase [Clostridium sp.]|nr:C39 family peptidase [Clostridium sp.]